MKAAHVYFCSLVPQWILLTFYNLVKAINRDISVRLLGYQCARSYVNIRK
jgi:beta-mannanase